MTARISVLLAALLAAAIGEARAAGKLDADTAGRIRTAVDVALRPIRFSQSIGNGSYGDARTTALAVRAFMGSHRRYNEADGPFITKALGFLSREIEGPARWPARLALSRSSKKPDPAPWPGELLSELRSKSTLADPSALAFAVEAVVGSGAPLDDAFWQAVAVSGGSAASEYVLALAAKSGRGDPDVLAQSVAARCARIGSAPYEDYYFHAATLLALLSQPPGCASALAQEILSRQEADGLWPAPAPSRTRLESSVLAVLALEKLSEVE